MLSGWFQHFSSECSWIRSKEFMENLRWHTIRERKGHEGCWEGGRLEDVSQMWGEAPKEAAEAALFQKSPELWVTSPPSLEKHRISSDQSWVTASSSSHVCVATLFLKITIFTEWLDPFSLVLSLLAGEQAIIYLLETALPARLLGWAFFSNMKCPFLQNLFSLIHF